MQKEGETVEQFITSLYQLAESCGYSDASKGEHIRDRIVCGIRDKNLSKEMQLKPDLTLDKAVELARHHELVSAQTAQLHSNTQTMDEVQRKRNRNQHKPQRPPQYSHQQQHKQQPQCHKLRQQGNGHCMRCGKITPA